MIAGCQNFRAARRSTPRTFFLKSATLIERQRLHRSSSAEICRRRWSAL